MFKHFHVNLHPSKPISLKGIIWLSFILNWGKCNTDEDALGSPGLASHARVFINNEETLLGGLSVNLGTNKAFHDELLGVMQAIEYAHALSLWNLLIQTNSKLVILSYKSSSLVPWHIRNGWKNLLVLTKDTYFTISHRFVWENGKKMIRCCLCKLIC